MSTSQDALLGQRAPAGASEEVVDNDAAGGQGVAESGPLGILAGDGEQGDAGAQSAGVGGGVGGAAGRVEPVLQGHHRHGPFPTEA